MTKDDALTEAERLIQDFGYAHTHAETVRIVALGILVGEREGLRCGAEIAERDFAQLRKEVAS